MKIITFLVGLLLGVALSVGTVFSVSGAVRYYSKASLADECVRSQSDSSRCVKLEATTSLVKTYRSQGTMYIFFGIVAGLMLVLDLTVLLGMTNVIWQSTGGDVVVADDP